MCSISKNGLEWLWTLEYQWETNEHGITKNKWWIRGEPYRRAFTFKESKQKWLGVDILQGFFEVWMRKNENMKICDLGLLLPNCFEEVFMWYDCWYERLCSYHVSSSLPWTRSCGDLLWYECTTPHLLFWCLGGLWCSFDMSAGMTIRGHTMHHLLFY